MRALFALLLCVGCSSAEPTTKPIEKADPATCAPPRQPALSTNVRFESLSAKLVDPAGVPVTDAMVTVCDANTCLRGDVGKDGAVVVKSAAGLDMIGPAFKVGDGVSHALLAYPLKGGPKIDLGASVAIALPTSGAAFSPGHESVSQGVRLTLAPGTVVGFDELTYPKELQVLRAAPIPLDRRPLAIDPSVELAWALAPQETTLCPPATLSLPNERGWAAGTAVEILAHGVELSNGWAPYGGFRVVSTAHVSADGATIQTDAGQGIPVITTLGVRRLRS